MARRRETHPALVVTGLAMVLPSLLGPSAMTAGGLLPLGVAAALGAGLAAPVALAEWTRPRDVPDDGLDVAVRATGDVWVALLVGAAAAPWVPPTPVGVAAVALAWLVAAALIRWVGLAAVPALAAAAVLVATPTATAVLGPAPGWTLLEPHLSAWRAWWPGAVVAGFLLAGAGFGQWAALPPPTPGARPRPWFVVGIALLASTLFAVRAGAVWERDLGEIGPDPVGAVAAALAVAAAATAVLARDGASRPFHGAAFGLLATLWFVGPARSALPLWWGTLVVVGPVIATGALAWRTRGADRLFAAIACGALTAAGVAGWPGVPSAAAAASAAVVVVVGLWVAGTRALVRSAP